MTLNWDNLGRWLVITRGGRTQAEMAALTGASTRSISAWESGALVEPGRKLRAYCEAIGWAPDALDRVLEGGEPEPARTVAVRKVLPLSDDAAALLAAIERLPSHEREILRRELGRSADA